MQRKMSPSKRTITRVASHPRARSSPLITHTITLILGIAIGISLCAVFLMYTKLASLSGENNDNNNIPMSDFVSTFAFPTIEERVKYYMGDWYGRSLHKDTISCKEIDEVDGIYSDQLVLWRGSKLKYELQYNEKKDWLIGSYLRHAYDVIKRADVDYDDHHHEIWVVLYIGDSHSESTKLPVVAKTRFSQFATAKGSWSGKTHHHFFRSIIFPLEMERHYDPVNEYIKLHKGGKVCKWNDKKSTLIWRGAVTGVNFNSAKKQLSTYQDGGSRIQVVKRYYNAKILDVDVAFEKNSPTVEWAPYEYSNEAHLTRDNDTSMADQLKYKYILMLEGNDVATGLKWQLASNSVVFMAKPTTVSFLMEDLLVPFVHYVPLKDDYSNLVEMVQWARNNDNKCKWISQQATVYMQRLWISKRAKDENNEVKKALGTVYEKQFGKALQSCSKKVKSSMDEYDTIFQ